ncbi:MAG TPA: winged helix-turn-helix domain-containing protein, partial [Polyangia bacterium]|nr:winged helix-turn-helix domain-containing protein [Polyangia bacterium]
MTFVDAAIEVLKREGQPLSIRRLAELAVKHNLLSVIGRDPEATMQERLDEAMARSSAHPDLVRIKPDTFGLHAYPPKPVPAAKPANGTPAATDAKGAEGEAPAGAADEAKKGRRRRRRGARRAEGAADEAGDAEAGDDAADGDSAAAAPGAAKAATAAAKVVTVDAAADKVATGAEAATGETASASEPAAGAAGAEGAPKATTASTADAAADATGEKKRRRRRGGRGRRRQGSPNVDGAEAGDDDADDADDADAPKAAAPTPIVATTAAAAAFETPATVEVRDPAETAESADAALETAETLPPEGEAAGTPVADAAAAAGEELLEGAEDLDDDFDHDTGPLLAPAHGAEDVTRTDDDRVVRPEIRGSRDERHRRDHRHKRGEQPRHGKPHEGKLHDKPAHAAQSHGAARPQPQAGAAPRPQQPHATQPHAPSAAAATTTASEGPIRDGKAATGLVEAVLDVLRNSDGRPMHVRLIAEMAAKRRLVDTRTPPADLVRLIRMALVGERREREAAGLRARVRNVGGGQFQAADKRLDPELFAAERELGDRVVKLGDATRAVIRRRIGRLAPPAFEALGRTLCDKLGVNGVELIRRGEGVAYFGGTRTAGAGTVRTLVALRPSESEINRRAVGELRAGLAAKGFDEGLLFAGGNPNAEALAE